MKNSAGTISYYTNLLKLLQSTYHSSLAFLKNFVKRENLFSLLYLIIVFVRDHRTRSIYQIYQRHPYRISDRLSGIKLFVWTLSVRPNWVVGRHQLKLMLIQSLGAMISQYLNMKHMKSLFHQAHCKHLRFFHLLQYPKVGATSRLDSSWIW